MKLNGQAEQNALIFCGGYNADLGVVAKCDIYDIQQDTWLQPLCSFVMQQARCNAGFSRLNGRLYALGGVGHHGYLDTVEIYNETDMSWTVSDRKLYEPNWGYTLGRL